MAADAPAEKLKSHNQDFMKLKCVIYDKNET